MNTIHHLSKKVDSYSMLIVSKYFQTKQDFINIICVCKKFQETTEKLRFNPISITSLKLFPQNSNSIFILKNDKKIEGINNYEVWYEINYDKYIKLKKNNIKFHSISYSYENRLQHGDEIPKEINMLVEGCYNYSEIKSITIPNQVTFIGSSCFLECRKLKSVELPFKLTKINFNCFFYCIELSSIKLPLTLESIGNNCFENCKFKNITIPDSVTSIGTACFCNCASLQSIVIPSSIVDLKENLFRFCLYLTSIKLPTTITHIGYNCFEGCKQLTAITLPPLLEIIGQECFLSMCGIKSIEIPESIQSIGFNCFSKCASLSNLTLQSPIKQFQFKVSYADSFLYQTFGIISNNIILTQYDVNLKMNEMEQLQVNSNEFIIPNGVVEITSYAFWFKTKLKSIIIPTTTTRIDNYCFKGCNSITSLTIPDSVQYVGYYCFYDCDNLRHIIIPPHLQINPNCYQGCSKLNLNKTKK